MNPFDSEHPGNHPARILSEYEELIDLAQRSTETIDALQSAIDKARTESLLGVFIFYLLLGAPVYIASRFRGKFETYIQTTAGVLTLLGSILSALVAFFAIYVIWIRLRRVRYELQSLRTEVEIHQRLLSLVDEQKKRVEMFNILSPVAMATFEIKTMRLHRNHK